ncbi:hypothetical protein NEFER03_1590 [Nematocida sp. LUAm3]|nr:hypothetical protein NEFER03_1590 [Nematocida sp. LUAm3]KAI5176379.1 hypothetical protein NEFER02_2153 [Nematocida sp. LUAm2]KAI5179039.1 hypothetical protein NEFER01_1915 [Nematocida sp. LUAm1]
MTRGNDPIEQTADLKPNIPVEMELPCASCGGTSVLRLLLVPDLFFPDAIISSSSCEFCGYRDKQIHQMESSSAGVKIKCNFKEKEDLRRYVVVSSETEIKIESGERGVTFHQKEDSVTVVESLIRFVLEKLISQGTMPEDLITEQEMEGLGEYKDIALFLQRSMYELDLTLTLTDNKGISRVLPRGATLEENTKILPFEYFMDDSVDMESYEAPRDTEEAIINIDEE